MAMPEVHDVRHGTQVVGIARGDGALNAFPRAPSRDGARSGDARSGAVPARPRALAGRRNERDGRAAAAVIAPSMRVRMRTSSNACHALATRV
jgi:hypothetical protein